MRSIKQNCEIQSLKIERDKYKRMATESKSGSSDSGNNQGNDQDIESLRDELDKYKRLAQERGEFIFNGAELGYISEPESEAERAYYTFLRCQMTDEAAIKSV